MDTVIRHQTVFSFRACLELESLFKRKCSWKRIFFGVPIDLTSRRAFILNCLSKSFAVFDFTLWYCDAYQEFYHPFFFFNQKWKWTSIEFSVNSKVGTILPPAPKAGFSSFHCVPLFHSFQTYFDSLAVSLGSLCWGLQMKEICFVEEHSLTRWES